MPITTHTTPASRTLAQWGKLTASQTRVVRFLLVNHFIECPQELIDLGIKHQTLKGLRFMCLLDVVPSRSKLHYCYTLSPAAVLALAHWGYENEVKF